MTLGRIVVHASKMRNNPAVLPENAVTDACRARQQHSVLQLAAADCELRISALQHEPCGPAAAMQTLARDQSSPEHSQLRYQNALKKQEHQLCAPKCNVHESTFGQQAPHTEELPSEYMQRTCQHTSISPGALADDVVMTLCICMRTQLSPACTLQLMFRDVILTQTFCNGSSGHR